MIKYEYKIFKAKSGWNAPDSDKGLSKAEQQLNEMCSEEGWEVVNMVMTQKQASITGSGSADNPIFLLRRIII